MKKNFLALAALVLTIAVSAFTLQPPSYKFADYISGTEKDVTNFTIVSVQPSHEFDDMSPAKLNWFRVEDVDVSGTISATEFNTAFEVYDVQVDGSDLLKDESADISGQLDLINKE